MNSNKLISIDDSDLEQVAGGLGFSFGVDAGRHLSVGAGINVGHGSVSVGGEVHVGPVKLDLGIDLSFGFGR